MLKLIGEENLTFRRPWPQEGVRTQQAVAIHRKRRDLHDEISACKRLAGDAIDEEIENNDDGRQTKELDQSD